MTSPPTITTTPWPPMVDPSVIAGIPGLPPSTADVLPAMTAAIRRYCGWHISPVFADLRTLDAEGGQSLQLPTLALVSLDVVTDNATGDDLDITGWTVSRTGTVRGGTPFPIRLSAYTVAFTHGFDDDQAAGLIQFLIICSARVAANPVGATTESVGSTSIALPMNSNGSAPGSLSLGPAERSFLDSYRLFPGA